LLNTISILDPFAGVDLATVDDATLVDLCFFFELLSPLTLVQEAVKTMREAAEDAETSLFNPAIEAASGADGMFSI
jgi:hypothetical protein